MAGSPPTPQAMSAPFILQRAQRVMFSSNGFRAPTVHYQPGASALFFTAEKWFVSDPFWSFGLQALLSNWWEGTAGSGGQENANGNSITYEAISWQIGNNGSPFQGKLNGSTSSYTLADDSEIWSDPTSPLLLIPPNTRCCVRVAGFIADSSKFVSSPGQGLRPHFGDKTEWGTSSLASKVMAKGISTTVPGGNLVYAPVPCAIAAKGWDGRPVGLIVGTSIEQGVGEGRLYCNAYGEVGAVGRGMTSQVGGAPRYPAANFAVSGGLAGGITGAGNNQGLTRRMRAFAALNPAGTDPFTFIYSGFGTNDQTSSLSAWQTTMTTLWTALKAAWPNAWLVQSTLWPRIQSSNGFTDVAGQSAQSANWTWPTGSACGLYNWKRQLQSPYYLDEVLDRHNGISNLDGGGTPMTWRTDILPSWQTTLSASTLAAATTLTAAAQAAAGDTIGFTADNPEAQIISTTSGGAAPFTWAMAASMANAHTSTAVIKEAVSADGTHPSRRSARSAAELIYAPAKIAGRFGGG